MRMSGSASLLLAACAVGLLSIGAPGCTRDLAVPTANVIRVTAATPSSGWAGAHVTVTGNGWGATSPSDVQIRFGSSSSTTPLKLEQTRNSFSAEVVVPDDAPLGVVPIAVTAPTGVASMPGAFTSLGFGRLRLGAVTGVVDMRVQIDRALPLPFPDQGVVMFSADYGWAAVVDPGASAPRQVLVPRGASDIAMTSSPANRGAPSTVFAISEDSELVGSACSGAVAGDLALLRFQQGVDGGPFATLSPACLHSILSGGDAVSGFPTVAVSPDGALAVVKTDFSIWTVDLSAEPPSVRPPALVLTANHSAPAWVGGLGGSRFILSLDSRLQILDAADGGFGPPADAGLEGGTYGAVAGGSLDAQARLGVVYAAIYGSGILQGFSLDGDQLNFGSSIKMVQGNVVALAYSSADQKLMASTRSPSGVVMLDGFDPTTPRLRSFSALDGAEAGAAKQGGNGSGLFYIAALGGTEIVAEITGASLGFLPLHLGLATPALRTRPGDAAGMARRELLVAAHMVNRIEQLDSELHGPLQHDSRLAPPGIDALATKQDEPFIYARHGLELRYLDGVLPAFAAPVLVEDPEQAWSIPTGQGSVPEIQVTPSGQTVSIV